MFGEDCKIEAVVAHIDPKTYRVLGMEEGSVSSLEDYLQEYFTRILKKLKEVGASSKQTNFYV